MLKSFLVNILPMFFLLYKDSQNMADNILYNIKYKRYIIYIRHIWVFLLLVTALIIEPTELSSCTYVLFNCSFISYTLSWVFPISLWGISGIYSSPSIFATIKIAQTRINLCLDICNKPASWGPRIQVKWPYPPTILHPNVFLHITDK